MASISGNNRINILTDPFIEKMLRWLVKYRERVI
jgi:hypothetical protein